MSAASTWRCAACDTYNDAGAEACAVCESPRQEAEAEAPPAPAPVPVPRASTPVRPTPAAKPPERPEPTRAEINAGCGCLLFLAAAAIGLVVLAIIYSTSVFSALTSLGASDSDPSGSRSGTSQESGPPSPQPSAEGPCPRRLTALMPDNAGQRGADLVAVYAREDTDPDEEYTICRTPSGELFFYTKFGNEPYSGVPRRAEAIEGGYEVTFPPNTFRFVGDEMTLFEDGERQWEAELELRSSPS